MSVASKITSVNDLSRLRLLLTQDEEGLAEFVFPNLQIGDVWWIPDSVSGFGDKEQHPWVVVRRYQPGRANVMACPRTTDTRNSTRGIVTPAGVLPDLDQEGLIVLAHRRAFAAVDFASYQYSGRLPTIYIQRILSFYRSKGKADR